LAGEAAQLHQRRRTPTDIADVIVTDLQGNVVVKTMEDGEYIRGRCGGVKSRPGTRWPGWR
jgi:hypothetical protein